MSEFDSPWKEALDRYLQLFLALFFPEIHDAIDWPRGYEALDKELEQIVREAESGKRLADKLFRVWRKDGAETWVLIHIEVQSQRDDELPRRMFIYHYRIFDRFQRQVVSLAILGDESPSWRPDEFGYNLWGCSLSLRFRTVKLLDHAGHLEALEAHPNPLGLIVAAHLQSQATRDDPARRCAWKVRLVKRLLDRGMEAEDVRQLFRFIDWLLELPVELKQQFTQEIHEYQKEKHMPYISTLERDAMERARKEELLDVIAVGIEEKFGDEGKQLMPSIRQGLDVEQLRAIQRALWKAQSLDDIRGLLPAG